RLGVAAVGAEVAEQARSQRLGLADVNQLAVGVEHAVHARPARALGPHLGAQHARAAALDAVQRPRGGGEVEAVRPEAGGDGAREQPFHGGGFLPTKPQAAQVPRTVAIVSPRRGPLTEEWSSELLTSSPGEGMVDSDISGMSAPAPPGWDICGGAGSL